jgi:hypothetical protein
MVVSFVTPSLMVENLYTNEVWVVKSNSSLKVEGKTNINEFECIVPIYGRVDTLYYVKSGDKNIHPIKSTLKIPILNFDCHHRVMTKDLQKTLKASTYPNMTIDFKSFSKILSQVGHIDELNSKAQIHLAGAKKNYDITFKIKKLNAHNLELTGTKTILFSDFELHPPSKLGGSIRVKDELVVEFKLQLFRAR